MRCRRIVWPVGTKNLPSVNGEVDTVFTGGVVTTGVVVKLSVVGIFGVVEFLLLPIIIKRLFSCRMPMDKLVFWLMRR